MDRGSRHRHRLCLCQTGGRHLEEAAKLAPSWMDAWSSCGYVPTETYVGRWVPGMRCQREDSRKGAAGYICCSFRLLFLACRGSSDSTQAQQLTRDLRGSGSLGRNWQSGFTTHRSSIGRARPAGYFCAGGSLPPKIVDPSKVRPPFFSKGRNHSLYSTRPDQPRPPKFGLDQTRPDSGKAPR